jgi:hypothetical protein
MKRLWSTYSVPAECEYMRLVTKVFSGVWYVVQITLVSLRDRKESNGHVFLGKSWCWSIGDDIIARVETVGRSRV